MKKNPLTSFEFLRRAKASGIKAVHSMKKYPLRSAVFSLVILVVIMFVFFAFHFWRELEQRADEPGATVRIGFSTDWEYGGRKIIQQKLTNQAPDELTKVVEYFNDVFHPELVIGGGDYIESTGVKVEKAKLQLREINEIFKGLDAPRAYVLGNHDIRTLSKADVMGILGIATDHSVQDIGNWRLVLFDANSNTRDDSDSEQKPYPCGYVSKKELGWLDAALETDRPTVVFSHHTPVATLTSDEYWRENIENADMIRAVLERHPNVVASVSGHTPRPQESVVNGVRYIVSDTLVSKTGLGAFATIELSYNPFSTRAEIVFNHYGLRRETYGGVTYVEKNKRERVSRMIRTMLFE